MKRESVKEREGKRRKEILGGNGGKEVTTVNLANDSEGEDFHATPYLNIMCTVLHIFYR
jgi:hypothetical protein